MNVGGSISWSKTRPWQSETWCSQTTAGNLCKNQNPTCHSFALLIFLILILSHRLQTNVLAGTLLSLLLLPQMVKTAEKHRTTPRLVFVSSGLHYMASFDNKLIEEPNFLRRYGYKGFRRYVFFLIPLPLIRNVIKLFCTIRLGPMGRNEYGDTKCTFLVLVISRGQWFIPPIKVFNVLFARALSDRLQGKPIIVNSLDPGFCYSSLRRHTTGFLTLMYRLMELALARTSEEGSRQIVFAAIGGDEENGGKDALRGAYITLSKIRECSDWVIGEDGQRAQNKIWVWSLSFDFFHSRPDYLPVRDAWLLVEWIRWRDVESRPEGSTMCARLSGRATCKVECVICIVCSLIQANPLPTTPHNASSE